MSVVVDNYTMSSVNDGFVLVDWLLKQLGKGYIGWQYGTLFKSAMEQTEKSRLICPKLGQSLVNTLGFGLVNPSLTKSTNYLSQTAVNL